MCFSKKPLPVRLDMSYYELEELLMESFPTINSLFIWDARFYFDTHEGYYKKIKDVLLNMPKYTTDKFDCENFALLCSARMSEKYKLNTCGIAIGDSPWGYHGYNLFVNEDNGLIVAHILEPQNGLIYEAANPSGYEPDIVIFG